MLPQSASIGFLFGVHTQVYTLQGIVITFWYVLEILAAASQIQKGVNIKDENNNSGLSFGVI